MYTRVGGVTFVAGATGAGLARTGFSVLVYALLAVLLLVGGLLLLRMAAVRRSAEAGDRV
jgi:hypothetical protein